MNIITSLQVSADCHHVFGGDANGFLFVWSLSRIYSEHLSRKDELQYPFKKIFLGKIIMFILSSQSGRSVAHKYYKSKSMMITFF